MPLDNPTPRQRVHITRPGLWSRSAGTDFWLPVHATLPGIAADELLTDYGWLLTSLSFETSTGGDFLSSAGIGTPEAIVFGANGDLLKSPKMFGSYAHGRMAQEILGYMPTKLTVEVFAAFTINSANETRSGFGLTEAGGTTGTAADAMAWIYTDGSNFTIRSAVDSDAGSTDDGDYHVFRIVISTGTTDAIEWFIDGTSQGTMDLQEDLWPCSFGAHVLTTNRLSLAWAHLWYS